MDIWLGGVFASNRYQPGLITMVVTAFLVIVTQQSASPSNNSGPIRAAIRMVTHFEKLVNDFDDLPPGPKRANAEAHADRYFVGMQNTVDNVVVKRVVYSERPTQLRVAFLTYFASKRAHSLGLAFFCGLLRSKERRVRSHSAFILQDSVEDGTFSPNATALQKSLADNFTIDREELKPLVLNIAQKSRSNLMVSLLQHIGSEDRLPRSSEAIEALGKIHTPASIAALNVIREGLLARVRHVEQLAQAK